MLTLSEGGLHHVPSTTCPLPRATSSPQLEFFVCDCLDDHPTLVPIFFHALRRQVSRPAQPSLVRRRRRARVPRCVRAALRARGPRLPISSSPLFRQIDSALSGGCDRTPAAPAASGASHWPVLHARRPQGTSAEQWEGLFEFVVWKLLLWLGWAETPHFVRVLCGKERFEQLEVEGA